jgi:GT2 family glycosyltransferase
MRIGVGIIAYNQIKSLSELIRTAHMTEHEVEMHIFLHSKLPAVAQICHAAGEAYRDTTVYTLGSNVGVARTWNNALIAMKSCDVSVIINDDAWFTEGDLDKIAEAAMEHRDAYAIFCAGFHVGFNTPINCHGMSCFAMQPIALEEIGFYDENFFPAYNEDVDYARRAAMAELKPFIVSDTNVHHIGSAAITTSPTLGSQNNATHHMNNVYWTSKWGCPVSEDPAIGYRYPFNNRRFHPYFIGQEERRTPYPAYNRSDRHIVRV